MVGVDAIKAHVTEVRRSFRNDDLSVTGEGIPDGGTGLGKAAESISGLRNLWLEVAFVPELTDLLADEHIEREHAGEGWCGECGWIFGFILSSLWRGLF